MFKTLHRPLLKHKNHLIATVDQGLLKCYQLDQLFRSTTRRKYRQFIGFMPTNCEKYKNIIKVRLSHRFPLCNLNFILTI